MSDQMDRFRQLAKELGLKEPRVASEHTSKSISLPVPEFVIPCGVVYVRDNFHDIKMTVVADIDIELEYDDIYTPYSKEQYEKDKKSSLWFGARDNAKEAHKKYKENKADYDSDDWYHKHWSSSPLVREGDKIWRVGGIARVYCEGIDKLLLPDEAFLPYKKLYNSRTFTLETYNYDGLKERLARIIQSAARNTDPDGIMRKSSEAIADLSAKKKIIAECYKQLENIWEDPGPDQSREILQTRVEGIVAMYRLGRYNKVDSQEAMDLVLDRKDYYGKEAVYKADTPLYRQDLPFDRFVNELRRFSHIAWREVI